MVAVMPTSSVPMPVSSATRAVMAASTGRILGRWHSRVTERWVRR